MKKLLAILILTTLVIGLFGCTGSGNGGNSGSSTPLKIGIPEEIIREWELGKQEPPEHLIQLMEQLVRMKENGEPDSCLRYHVSADIYLSPSLMDVLYERGVILRERDVTADVVESELEKYIPGFTTAEGS